MFQMVSGSVRLLRIDEGKSIDQDEAKRREKTPSLMAAVKVGWCKTREHLSINAETHS